MKNWIFIAITLLLTSLAAFPGENIEEITCEKMDFSLNRINQSEQNVRVENFGKAKWIWNKKSSIKGVMITIHGLNNKPSTMDYFGRRMNTKGIKVLRVPLAGHRGDIEEMKRVVRDDWHWSVYRSYCLAKAEADKYSVPLYFAGNSLGALMFIDTSLQGAATPIKVEKMILFAPAIAVKKRAHLVRALRVMGSRFILPSKTPYAYRANRGTSVAAYKALFRSLNSVQVRLNKDINIPTLIFIDPQDELISLGHINSMIKHKQLDHWSVKKVNNAGSTLPKTYHHLIIDEESVGTSQWKEMEDAMWEHLKLQ